MLLCQVESLIEGEDYETGVLANVSAALASAMQQFFWTGFYLVNDNELCLGPFQGTVACYRIPYNKGVCGTRVFAERHGLNERRWLCLMWMLFQDILHVAVFPVQR